jgi:protein involved in polysaccharide export with SLBB domain
MKSKLVKATLDSVTTVDIVERREVQELNMLPQIPVRPAKYSSFLTKSHFYNALVTVAASAATLSACLGMVTISQAQTTEPAASATSVDVPPAVYRINSGDVLEISIFQKPELTRSVTVPPDGRISYPFVGELVVSGQTVREVTTQLKTRLSRELTNPQVTVNLTRRQLQEVSILGPVRNPGKRILGDNWRVLQLIADSGGLSAKPDMVTAKLVRGHGAEVVRINLSELMAGEASQNLLLQPDDTLLLDEVDPRSVSVQVMGEVAKPGSVSAPGDGSLVTLITSAGGFTPRAALSRVALVRGGKSYSVDMRDLMTTGKAALAVANPSDTDVASGNLKVEPGDTYFIPQSRLFFSVLGAVNKPGLSDFPDGQQVTVLSAILLAGGTNANADLKNSSLVRPNTATGQPEIKAVNLEDLLKYKDKEKDSKKQTRDIALQPGDVLYIPDKGPGKRPLGLGEILSFVPVLGWLAR